MKFLLGLLCAWTTLFSSQYIDHPSDPTKKIEYLELLPDVDSYPVLFYFHGASMDGGNFSLRTFQHWVDKGVGVVAISLPGYGQSDGEKDFCGPFTMQAVHALVDHFQADPKVSAVGGVGFGQGALALSLLACQRDDLECAVSANCMYDLECLHDSSHKLRQILTEKGYALEFEEEQIAMRSPLKQVTAIKTPLYLIQAEQYDEPALMASVKDIYFFQKAVIDSGGECEVAIIGHPAKRVLHEHFFEMEDWVLERLFR